MMRTPSDLPVHPNTLGIVLHSGRRTTESGELPHALTALNIASTLGVAHAATAVDHLPCNVADDGYVVALAVRGMQTASPCGGVSVEGTPARMSTRYEAAFGGSNQLVLSSKAEDEDSQPLLSPPTASPFPTSQHNSGGGATISAASVMIVTRYLKIVRRTGSQFLIASRPYLKNIPRIWIVCLLIWRQRMLPARLQFEHHLVKLSNWRRSSTVPRMSSPPTLMGWYPKLLQRCWIGLYPPHWQRRCRLRSLLPSRPYWMTRW